MDTISVVVPCYNEEKSLPFFYEKICEISSLMNCVFEFIFVDDGSSDSTLDMLKDLRSKDPRVRYISFSRNFGKEAGMLAGLKAAKGGYVAIMDADLQDPPELLIEMYRSIKEEKYDCVAARRVSRAGEPKMRSFFAHAFYKTMRVISKVDMVDGARDFRLMSRQVVNAIISMPEVNRFSKGIFGWVGFKTKWISFENAPRVGGNTKWSMRSLLAYSLSGILAFSQVPLAIASIVGLLFFIISFLMIIVVIVKTLVFQDPVSGWASTVCIIFFVGGVQIFCVGIICQYLSKMYLEVKGRPLYFVRETEDDDKYSENQASDSSE